MIYATIFKINIKILSEGKIVVKTTKIKQLSGRFSILAAVVAVTVAGGVAFAANNPNFTQEIVAGSLVGKILDASGAEVASPSVALSQKNFSFACQSSTGTLSTAAQRLYVENATTGGGNGWTMSINAATPGTGTFVSGVNNMAYNGAGCTDGSYAAGTGQLSLNTSASTVNTDSGVAGTVSKGAGGAFTGSNAVTLMTATAANTMWRGHITDIAVTQKIPPAQPTGNYSMNFVVTTTAQ